MSILSVRGRDDDDRDDDDRDDDDRAEERGVPPPTRRVPLFRFERLCLLFFVGITTLCIQNKIDT